MMMMLMYTMMMMLMFKTMMLMMMVMVTFRSPFCTFKTTLEGCSYKLPPFQMIPLMTRMEDGKGLVNCNFD